MMVADERFAEGPMRYPSLRIQLVGKPVGGPLAPDGSTVRMPPEATPARRAPVKSATVKFTPLRFAFVKFAPENVPPESTELVIVAFVKFAPEQSESAKKSPAKF